MHWTVGKGATIGFGLAVAVLLASTALFYRNFRLVAENEVRVSRAHDVLGALRSTLAALTDAETGQRGYIITGEAGYLEHSEAATDAIVQRLSDLAELTAGDPDQQGRLAGLHEMVVARLKTIRDGIAARDDGGPEGGRRFVQSGTGRQQTDAIRAKIREIETFEADQLAVHKAESRSGYRTVMLSLFGSALLGLGLIAAAYTLAAREAATRRRAADILSQMNDALEERVQERTFELESAVESLRRSNRDLEQFASIASHDLQEPLRKIQAFGDRLQSKYAEGLGEQGRDYVERMQGSAARMRNLIDALLTFSRVTTKARPFESVDLTATADDVISDLEGRLQETGGHVEVGDLPRIDADPFQMRQLLQNLVGNGLKFHKPGERPVVRVESRLLNGDEGQPPRCEIAVQDNGIGFEETYLDRIFDVFQRLHGRRDYEGTGMGLAICRKIVERHEGAITAKSVPGRGTTFLVTLPLRHEKEEPHDEAK